MSKNFGGTQSVMRDTTNLANKGYLGPHSPRLRVGDAQSMVSTAEDSGPWYYMSPANREQRRHNAPTGKK
jgi:hypothetical protein